jgi:DNA mismatch repair protein MutS
MPGSVIARAQAVFKQLERSHADDLASKTREVAGTDNMQLSFFQLDDPVLINIKDELLATDINSLTPVEALMKLNEIRKMVGG